MGISSYYFKNLEGKITRNNYWDANITSDNSGRDLNYATKISDSGNYNIVKDKLVFWLDVNNTGTTVDGTSLTSLVTWDDFLIKYTSGETTNCNCYYGLSTNPTGITSCDWGLTGVDNGRYDKLSGITVTFTTADTKVILYPVTGYTVNTDNGVGTKGKYDYPWTYLLNTITNQEINPNNCCSPISGESKICEVGNVICLDGGFYQGFFKLDLEDPNPEKISGTTFECDKEIPNLEYKRIDPNAFKYDLMPINFNVSNGDCNTGTGGWSMETWVKWDNSNCNNQLGNTLNNNFSANTGFFFYIGTRAENKFKNVFSGESGLYTCDGVIPLSPEGEKPKISNDGQDWFSISDYNFNDSCCRVCPEKVVSATTATTYCDELSENALGFRITPEGKIGYRKMTVSGYEYWCDDTNDNNGNNKGLNNNCTTSKFYITGTTMEESYSDIPIILSGDNWTHIVVTYNQNSFKHGFPAGTLKFWVNGRVVYRVENFIGLQLRALNEKSSKQLGVPYNISWGGGTQGLLESQTFSGPDQKDENLDLAKYFAGTFDGELSQLRFYSKTLNLLEIRNNLYAESGRYCIRETYGGSLIVQPTLIAYNDLYFGGKLITSDNLGLLIDLTVEFSPGSIIAKYMADIKRPLTKDLTLKFKSKIDVVSGNTITVSPEIFIGKGSTYGETTITIDDDYDRITDKHDIVDFENVTEENIKVKRNDKVIYKMPVKSSKTKITPTNPDTPVNPDTPINNDLIVYYGKLTTPNFDGGMLDTLTSKVYKSIVNSYLSLEEGSGFGYILIPKEMEQPTLFRNSNDGCVGFAIPMLDLGEITLGESSNNTNFNNSNNNSKNQSIYRIYRTFVSTYANIDIWLCD